MSNILTIYHKCVKIYKHLRGRRDMQNKTKKVIASIIAYSIFITGCKNMFDIITGPDIIAFPTTNTESTNYQTENTEEIEFTIDDSQNKETTEQSISQETAEEPETTENQETIEDLADIPDATVPKIDVDIVTATTETDIRSGNSEKSLAIGNLNIYDTAYKILSYDNNWDLIKTNDQIGFVLHNSLSQTEEVGQIEHNYKPKQDIAVTTTQLNFRKDANTSSEIIKTFKANEELKVIAEVDDEWLLVEQNGGFGYVHKGYTFSVLEKIQTEYPELDIDKLDLKKVIYVTSDLNIRAGNSQETESFGILETKESLRVYGEYEDWYFVMTNEHQLGFVHKDYTQELDGTFIIIDKSIQRMFVYNEDELLFYTPVTTGKDSTPSDTGLFEIFYKDTDLFLNGDKDWVDYWLYYNGAGEGIHNAPWREVYGEENYHWAGSHGCINTPKEVMAKIYANSFEGEKVLVHK